MSPLDVWGGVPRTETDSGVTYRPRVRHGRIVLSRRSWTAAADTLPVREPGGTDEAWYLDWHRWRVAHGLPDRVFATRSGGPGAPMLAGSKPQYLDFDSYLSLAAFDAQLKDRDGTVVFREMLPAGDELHATSERGNHVAELAIETLRTTRRQ
jgi:hypothetical protein